MPFSESEVGCARRQPDELGRADAAASGTGLQIVQALTTASGMLAAVVLLGIVSVGCRPATEEAPRPPSRLSDIVLARDSDSIRALVPQRTTLSSLLITHHLIGSEAAALVQTLSEKFDLRRFRAGQPYRLDLFFDGRVREFEYEIDRDRRLIVRRTAEEEAAFHAEIASIPKTIEQVVVEGAITRDTPSLVQAIDAAGEHIELSLALAEVFAGEMDFNSDLQPGDTFRLIVERATRRDGAFGGYGPVLAAEFVNAGRTLEAIRFTPPEGAPGYYDSEGRSLKRFFLKSPLKFEPRITSSFSRARRHPVLNYTRAHNGVDYAAPPGAPVGSVASGVVTFAGWTNGGGRTVRVRHTSGYESEYLHLSAIAVRTGARIGQGDLVGRVGATGLATGPHLHYGLRRNGAYVNPVREHQNMPPGEPVADVHRARFDEHRHHLFRLLEDSGLRAANNNN
jgi:murein DD-endopeptidase MepM/ murein hydrolase activator NlpD